MESQFQPSFDWTQKLPPDVQEKIADGIQRADEHAKVEWKRVTDGAILAVARRMPEFTVDDILAELDAVPCSFTTHNLAALGPRMKEVAKVLKYMTATDRVQRSKRLGKNGNLHRVWKSNLFGAKP